MTKISWPNRVTLTRILLIAPFVASLLHLDLEWPRHVALGIFLVMALSDAIDGYLARRLNQFTQLGAILDPIADKILITTSMILLAYEGTAVEGKRIPDLVVVAVIGKDLAVVLGFFVVILLTGKPLVRPRKTGKAATAVQLVTVLAVLLWPDMPGWLDLLPNVLWWLAAALAVVATLDYVLAGARFVATYESQTAGEPEESAAGKVAE